MLDVIWKLWDLFTFGYYHLLRLKSEWKNQLIPWWATLYSFLIGGQMCDWMKFSGSMKIFLCGQKTQVLGGETEQIIGVICHVTKHKYWLLLYLTMLNFKNGLPIWFSLMNTFWKYDLLIDMYCRGFRIAIILLFIGAAILFCFVGMWP